MSSALHSKQTITQGIHGAVALEFANAADRTSGVVSNPAAYSLTAADVGKIVRQVDNNSYWILSGFGPLVWTSISGSSGAVASDTLVFSCTGLATSTTTRYIPFGYLDANAVMSPISFRLSRAGTLKSIRVHHNTVGVGGNVTYTVLINGTPTSLAVTMAVTSSDGSDLVTTVAVSAGDLIDIRVTKPASITSSPAEVTVSVEFST